MFFTLWNTHYTSYSVFYTIGELHCISKLNTQQSSAKYICNMKSLHSYHREVEHLYPQQFKKRHHIRQRHRHHVRQRYRLRHRHRVGQRHHVRQRCQRCSRYDTVLHKRSPTNVCTEACGDHGCYWLGGKGISASMLCLSSLNSTLPSIFAIEQPKL